MDFRFYRLIRPTPRSDYGTDRTSQGSTRSPITGRPEIGSRMSLDFGRMSRASSVSTSMDLTYRDYWSPITGRPEIGSRMSLDFGRMSRASSVSTSMDLTYRDYWGPPNYTPFDEKFNELHFFKYRTKKHVKKLNSLKYNYIEWFKSKCQSFLDCVKLTQILASKLVPNEIENIQDFKKVHDMSKRFPRNGTPRDSNPAKMDDFMMFWQEMVTLKEETDDLYESLGRYCESVTRLRLPSVKLEIDRLKGLLDQAYAEDFNFTDLKNERENLFVYKVAPYDYRYHGLLGYIPFLLTLTLRIMTLHSKIYLEKE